MIHPHIQRYLSFLANEKNASPHTVKNYQIDLREFTASAGEKSPEDVTYLDIRSFLAYLKNHSYSKSSVARKLACIRSFFKYLSRENILKANPTLNISS
ncbi:MAG: site-specific integrase, partial [candidate division Zixibacteria bacterium]|nr:site-specific integrase [candidate division Zixibacteria bacterium]